MYPAHGVAEVVGLETREIGGNKQTFYILKILETGMKVMIPTRNVAAVGLREVISDKDVKEVYNILKSRRSRWKGRRGIVATASTLDKIKTGSVFEIAEVLRDLSLLKELEGSVVRQNARCSTRRVSCS